MVQFKYPSIFRAHLKIESSHPQGTTPQGFALVMRLHIAGESSSPGEVAPLAEYFNHAVFLTLPDESIRAIGFLCQGWRFIESNLNLFADKSDWSHGNSEKSTL